MLWRAALFLLTITVLTAQQGSTSRGLSLVTIKESKTTARQQYGVVIGISRYADPQIPQLAYPDADAEALYSILTKPEGGDFRAENLKKLVGSNANLANVRQAFDVWLPSVAKENDRVLIFFAGHGLSSRSDGQPYLALYDSVLARLPETAYSMADFGDLIGQKIKAREKVVLVDACQSGAIAPGSPSPVAGNEAVNAGLQGIRGLHRVTGGSSLFLFTASRAGESSIEKDEYRHGVFTYFLVKGLEGAADLDHDRVVTADEIGEYVHANVRKSTGNQQSPTSDRGIYDATLPLAYPKISTATSESIQYGSLVVDSNRDGVTVLVDGRNAGSVKSDERLRIEGLPEGPHKLQGFKRGYQASSISATVLPGQANSVRVSLNFPRIIVPAAADSFKKGLESYNKSDYKKAAVLFSQALDAQPNRDYSEAALYLGRTYRELSQFDQSEKFLQLALEKDPDYAEARESLGAELLNPGDVDRAIGILNDVVVSAPEREVAQGLLSQALLFKGQYQEAATRASKAIFLKPDYAEAHFYLAEALKQGGNCPDAVPEYDEFLRLSGKLQSSTSGEVFNYWVRGLLVGGGKRSRAAQADIWSDQRSLAYANLGNCAAMRNQFDEAVAQYTKSIAINHQDPQVYWGLAQAQVAKADTAGDKLLLPDAGKTLCRMIRLNPPADEADAANKLLSKIESFTGSKRQVFGCP